MDNTRANERTASEAHKLYYMLEAQSDKVLRKRKHSLDFKYFFS